MFELVADFVLNVNFKVEFGGGSWSCCPPIFSCLSKLSPYLSHVTIYVLSLAFAFFLLPPPPLYFSCCVASAPVSSTGVSESHFPGLESAAATHAFVQRGGRSPQRVRGDHRPHCSFAAHALFSCLTQRDYCFFLTVPVRAVVIYNP